MTRLLILLLALAAAACARKEPPPPEPDVTTRREIAQGEIVGFTSEDGAHVWRAIPFAAPPVGDLRLRAPRTASGWEGVREATRHAPRCAQLSNALNRGEGIPEGRIIGEEDCLYLNVFAPPDAQGQDLPVMVWIHGGGNVWGRASNYDASRLAVNENVIVVTTQYRVGPLGFFSHDLLREDAQTPEDRAANFALLDLIAALDWVHDNIGAFGGDPDLVTIFGESAGGHNVAALLASPLAAGKFHRAIIQSGSFDSVSQARAEKEDENASSRVLARMGVSGADALRAASLDDLFAAYRDGDIAFLEMPTVIEDGITLPDYPIREAFDSKGAFNVVPVMTGTNRDEMKFFNFARPDLVKRKLFLFPVPRDPEYYAAVNEYPSRIWRIRAVDGPAARMAEAGHTDVYAYRFDWDESGTFVFSDFSELVGAGHAVDIPFVFNRFELFGPSLDRRFFPKESRDAAETLSRAMGAYWAAFARTGAPGDAGGPAWTPWSTNGGSLMIFDTAADGGLRMKPDIDAMARLRADLKADPRLTDAERCEIVAETALWSQDLADMLGAGLDCASAP